MSKFLPRGASGDRAPLKSNIAELGVIVVRCSSHPWSVDSTSNSRTSTLWWASERPQHRVQGRLGIERETPENDPPRGLWDAAHKIHKTQGATMFTKYKDVCSLRWSSLFLDDPDGIFSGRLQSPHFGPRHRSILYRDY
ncbi:hypothetical protein AcV5_010463 [Taiwanofungus camphoratus]|nr:hypothetical protein AcV5_010463 [Antrodia cinnamomea]